MSVQNEMAVRDEYLASSYPSGSAGYRRFVCDRITELESQVTALQSVVQVSKKIRDNGLSCPTMMGELTNVHTDLIHELTTAIATLEVTPEFNPRIHTKSEGPG
jgi:hypothetical protein